jgi:hypothetical protein
MWLGGLAVETATTFFIIGDKVASVNDVFSRTEVMCFHVQEFLQTLSCCSAFAGWTRTLLTCEQQQHS